MLSFLIRRLLVSVLVALTVSVVAFSFLRLSGDLAALLAGENAKPDEIARIAHQYGLDQPLFVQYLDWAGARCTATSAARCSAASRSRNCCRSGSA